ncbi:MAG TPA: FHA domain-containing protein [Sandaracinaceae bacterium LLY-WYZ-13_1]|nr:FHA domain-containing protein [Sandaracinaceae bacterium LLY-WYZ-13_1]
MGRLRCSEDGRRVTLGPRTLVGRGTLSTLQLDHPSVSAEHASVYWHDDAWFVRDLGSTNGTFVDGARVEPGEKRRITAGSTLRFGDSVPSLTWLLERDGSPGARAWPVGGGEPRMARGELLLLPDTDEPRVAVFGDDERRWVAEVDGELRTVEDQDLLHVGGVTWRLSLPTASRGGDVSTTLPIRADLRVIDACAMELRVSRDEEYVEVTLRCGLEAIPLPPRSFHYTLLTLARRRLEDEALPAEERGWIHADDLARQLGISKPKLNLDVCRARQQLAELGIGGAGRLIQRRRTSHQLRLGISRLSVTSPSRGR